MDNGTLALNSQFTKWLNRAMKKADPFDNRQKDKIRQWADKLPGISYCVYCDHIGEEGFDIFRIDSGYHNGGFRDADDDNAESACWQCWQNW